jgi:hypothetical protein
MNAELRTGYLNSSGSVQIKTTWVASRSGDGLGQKHLPYRCKQVENFFLNC